MPRVRSIRRRSRSLQPTYRPALELFEDRVLPASRPNGLPDVRPAPEPFAHAVRTYYLIPSDRQPQPRAVESLQNSLLSARSFYQDLMERNGFGPKTFALETDQDGVTPRVHLVHAPQPAAYYRADPWGRVNAAAVAAGLPIWGRGQVWLAYFEGHLMDPDGSVAGGFAGGGSFGSGSAGGVAMLGSNGLAVLLPEDLTDDRPYHGTIRPALGPYPMVQDVTFPSFARQTYSSISSTARGAALHELGHAFGLPHDFRNDANFHGNLMGNGFRGFRGWARSDRYPGDDLHLAYGSALALNVSRYFNAGQVFGDDTRPTLTVHTAGAVDPVDGQVEIHFTAEDARGLAAAFLRLDGERVAELPLTGTQASVRFATAYYTPGQVNEYSVTVLDAAGNRQDVATSVTPTAGFNRAPRPHVRITPTQAHAGQPVLLDAGRSTDPDHAAAVLLVEWDLDGDGTFDTAPTTEKTLWTTFVEAGTRRIAVRVTDPEGARSVSAPLGIRVAPGDFGAPATPGGGYLSPLEFADTIVVAGVPPKGDGGGVPAVRVSVLAGPAAGAGRAGADGRSAAEREQAGPAPARRAAGAGTARAGLQRALTHILLPGAEGVLAAATDARL